MKELKTKIKNIKKEEVIFFIIGLTIGLLTMLIFYPERIAELKNGENIAIEVGKNKITADTIYKGLKESYGVNEILTSVDKVILEKKYKITEEDEKEIDETAQKYLSYYKESYGMSEEDFLKRYGYEDYEAFTKYLELDYLRNKYYLEYLNNEITEEEIDEYYEEKVFGKINTEHILVETSTENAEELANEILDKLNDDTSWEDLKTEYKDQIITETVTVSFDSNLEENYKNEAKNLENDSYSKSLVKTNYGYHIIYRKSEEEKEEKADLETRIKDAIIKEKETNEENLYEKVMIQMRKDENMDIKDTELKKVYNDYIKQYE